jgi:hypothetical protein
VKVTLKILLKAVSEVIIDTHFTVRNFFLLFQLNAHNMLNTYIFIAYYLLHVSGFLHHLQGDDCVICSKTICFFAMLLHWLCYRI